MREIVVNIQVSVDQANMIQAALLRHTDNIPDSSQERLQKALEAVVKGLAEAK